MIYYQQVEQQRIIEKNMHEKLTQMTDAVRNFPAQQPEGKIILFCCVATDGGIGDFIHQIRAFQALNLTFPGKIESYTLSAPEYNEKLKIIAKDENFYTTFATAEIGKPYILPANNASLIIVVSTFYPSAVQLPPNAGRSIYFLREIQKAGKLEERAHVGTIGFLPRCEGLWIDDIPEQNNPGALIVNSTSQLITTLNCPVFDSAEEAGDWLSKKWISQSYYYDELNFISLLLAQLNFIELKKLNIDQVFIKFAGSTREGKPWDLNKTLESAVLRNALLKLNVKSITINDTVIMINGTNTIEVKLFKKFLSKEDYKIFQQLMNGVVMPGGDNTYSEGWSNANTLLPPILEIRKEKREIIKDIHPIIDELKIASPEKKWLHDLFKLCYEMNEESLTEDTALSLSNKFATLWATPEINNPHEIWQQLHIAIQKHDLSKRLPAIISERILFIKHPTLFDKKNQLVQDNTKSPQECVGEYSKKIAKKLAPGNGNSKCIIS